MRGLSARCATVAVAAATLLYLPAGSSFSATASDEIQSVTGPEAGSWARTPCGTSLDLHDVFGGAARAFAVGDNGTLLFFDGFTWTTLSTPTTSSLRGVWAGDAGDVYAVGDAGRVLRFDGASVTLVPSNTSANLRAVWGRNPGDVYAVGDNGTIMRFDGSTWTRQISGTMLRLYDVWGHPDTGTFAVGDNGTVVRLAGDRWVVMPTPTTRALRGVWVDGGGAIAVGDAGTVLRLTGGEWRLEPSGTSRNLTGVWIISPRRAFAVGEAYTILFHDGATWTRMDSNAYANLAAVNNGYAAGDNGVVLQNTTVFHEASNLRITEVIPARGLVEVTNTGGGFESAELPFAHRDDFASTIPARTFFGAGEIRLFDVFGLGSALGRTDSDLWLYRSAPFDDGENIIHGVKYGERPGIGRTATAVDAGLWPGVSAFTPAPPLGTSIAYDGFGNDPKDWYVDETPSPGVANRSAVGVVDSRIVYPHGTQGFEDVDLGDEVVAIRGWTIVSPGDVPGAFTTHVVGDVDGSTASRDASTRWVRVRDQDDRDVSNRFHTTTVVSPAAGGYVWRFQVNLEEVPAASMNPPALVVQHDSRDGFADTWGLAFRPDGVYLFVARDGGNVDDARVLDLQGGAAPAGWMDLGIALDLSAGVVRGLAGGLAAAELAVAPGAGIDATRYRLSYNGSGPGNVGTLLLDDVSLTADGVVAPILLTNVTATPGAATVDLRWDVYATEAVAGVRIERREETTQPAVSVSLPAGARSYHDAAVVAGGSYRYVVTATTVTGTEARSQEIMVTLSRTAGVSFRSMNANTEGARVWLSWSVSGADAIVGYRLYRREDGGGESVLASEAALTATVRRFRDETVELWKAYEYVVAAVTQTGEEIRSETAAVRVTAATPSLAPNSPNPFRAATTIEFTLTESANVVLNVYDVRGRLVATIDRGNRPAGVHRVTWDGRDNGGNRVSAGTYFYRLSAAGFTTTRKMVLVR